MHTECTRKYMYDIEKNTKFVIACNNQYKCKIMKDIVIIITLSLFLCATSCAQDIKDNPQFAKSVKSNIRKAKRSSGISRPFSISKKDMKDIDSCRIKVYYDVKFVKDTADRASVCKDLQRLDIGYNYTYCYSRLLHINDSLRTIAYEKDENYPSKLDENDVLPEEILTNTKTKTLNVRRRMYYNYTNLCYNEAAPKIEWKQESGSKTIIGYQCKKASCTFRGRKYTAWYTPDIPIYSGPYKFAGLPGLIMQISSDDNDYIWTCVGLEKGRPGDMITTYKAHNMKEKVMTREKIMALIKKIYKDPGGALGVGGPKELFVSDDRKTVHMVTSGDYPPEPYNPIELE